ncbi:hypothetical protein [Paracoccus thiocyanatus]|uniref:Type I secretion protein ATPase n=1 Tax=Paracoccus thiocyanatus TaxID=34006 RepID=A0A3D8P9D5_9RHOB|nr:hypothetical protein [Paracoccus thiocyanatus]RDW11861.1 hypothetical protein DIE28_16970 [Paracoccus thiocyanatus]
MLTIDAAEEAIWHFVGVFHMAQECGRMRIDYDRLVPRSADPDLGPIQTLDLAAWHPYRPLDHLPEIRHAPPAWPAEGLAADPRPPAMTLPAQAPQGASAPGTAFEPALTAHPAWTALPPGVFPPPPPDWTLPVPGSVAVIAVQKTRLADDDQLDPQAMRGGLVDAAQIASRLEAMAAQAEGLGIALPIAMPADEPAFRLIAEAFRQAELPAQGPGTGPAEIHGRQGADVQGNYLDGVKVDARPDMDALMPAYRQEAARLAEQQAGQQAAAPRQDGPSSAGPAPAPASPDGDQGHDLVLGNNTLVNEVVINSAVLSAPVVVVAGGVYSYSIVSQVNLWSDADTLFGAGMVAGQTQDAPTQGVNYASHASFSNPMPLPQGGDGAAPQYWLTATLEGSLVGMNWIDQYNLMSDGDVASITLQAGKTLLLMGENGALNQVSLAELGMHYDLVIVDGQIINLNAVLQTNVLLDDDRIMVDGAAGAAIGSGDNLLINDATILQSGQSSIVATSAAQDAMLAAAAAGKVALPDSVLNDPAFQGLDVVRVLHIQGDLVSVNIVRQTNVLGDADQIELYRDDLLPAGGEVRLITGSNLLVNAATIAEFGVDATIHSGGEVYSDALLHQAELVLPGDPLLPVPPGGLATEAVLFLADGMLGDDGPQGEFVPIGTHAELSVDAMETVLA